MPRFPYLTRSRALRAAAAVAALAVTVPVAGSSAVPSPSAKPRPIQEIPCRKSSTDTNVRADWQVFPSPTFTVAVAGSVNGISQDVDSYAVDPHDPNRIVVSNKNSIQISRDGGCSWLPSLRLDDIPSDPRRTPLVGAVNVIKGLYISPSRTIYATVEELETGSAVVGRPHVIRSSDGAQGSWDLGDTGLPPLGHPLTLKALASNPKVMYLSFAAAREDTAPGGTPCPPAPLPCPGGGGGGGQSLGLLWGSTDGGATWSARTDPQDLNGASAIKYFSVEDNDASGNTLWVVANGSLRKSTDGGHTYKLPSDLSQDGFTFTAVETIDKGEARNQIELVAFSTGGEMIRRVSGVWKRSFVPFQNVESVAQLPDGEIALATAPAGSRFQVWRIFRDDFRDFEEKSGLGGTIFRVTFGWEQITPDGGQQSSPRISGGDAGASSAGTFYVKDRRQLLRFLGSNRRRDRALVPPSPIGAPPPPHGTISPRLLTFDLPIGKTRTVDYTLTLPPAPTPIDVYLLLDNSGSMEPLISDLKKSLGEVARRMVDTGVDVNMGVGQINVQPDPGSPPPIDNPGTPDVDEGQARPLYKRLRVIGPVDAGLFTALNQVDGNGGSGSEAQLESLYQSVTGEGLSTNGVPWLLGYDIEPHQDARFRSATSSIKVIVHATDEGFSENIQGGHNKFPDVIKALRNLNVLQIGLSQGVTEAAEDLATVAKGTGAVAPAGGVDCDGDGRTDILAGRALVCGQNYGLDVTLVNLLKSIADPQTITLRGSSTPTLAAISSTAFAIDAKQATHVGFRVTYSCVGLAPGGYVNSLSAGLRGTQIANAVATVNCGGVSTPPRVVPNPGEPSAPQPPPAPQPAVPAIAPVNPLPQAQSQVQTQVNPQAGAADQEQEQLQVAGAENDITNDEEELAMSRLDSRWNTPGLGYAAGMAMASAVGVGVALRRRTRTRVARAS